MTLLNLVYFLKDTEISKNCSWMPWDKLEKLYLHIFISSKFLLSFNHPLLDSGSDRGYSSLLQAKLGVAPGGSQIETCKNNSWTKIFGRGPFNTQISGLEK